ncbi:MAG TPA: DUF6125 family protein [Methanospirillum sp.]|nr:DUF6125 family protein [Methanospirillum sp.]
MDTDSVLLRNELVDAAKNWLAIDGLWFLEVEKRYGLDTAIAIDAAVWEQFSRIEAVRICKRLNLPKNGGLNTLEIALKNRLFSLINQYEIRRTGPGSLEYYMTTCRTQEARVRKGMALFPCKVIGLVDHPIFAQTIDPRIITECISCPPDIPSGQFRCGWRFLI